MIRRLGPEDAAAFAEIRLVEAVLAHARDRIEHVHLNIAVE